MRLQFTSVVLLSLSLAACRASAPPPENAEARPGAITARLPIPPPMPRRAIAPPAAAPPGEQIQLDDEGTKFTLFIPATWEAAASGEIAIVAHFHGAVWFAIDEHLRHGLNAPLICFALGQGSSVYGGPFKDRERFGRILRITEAELKRHGAPKDARVTQIDITSFSAGYGAVREIVQVPEYLTLIRRVILADSLYAGWDAPTQPGATSRPAAEHMDPWTPFVRAAARGEKTFVLTHSRVPTSYANTEACARALIEVVGARIVPLERGSLPATLDADFPLLYRADLNGFHVWGYGGADGPAHMTHARHIADIWKALDDAEAPTTAPSEIRRGMSMRDPPQVRYRRYWENLARQIEPDLLGNPSRLDVYLRFFDREIVRDKRLFACDIAATYADGTVTLRGFAEYPEQVAACVTLLETLGFKVAREVELMPTASLGDRRFAKVTAKRSFLYSSPEEPREVVNEVIAGEQLFLLRENGPMMLCHAPDGYVGWIKSSDVIPVSAPALGQGRQVDPRIATVVATAKSMLGRPYVWGGRSDGGVDCSGLVQAAFASVGINLPRDAEQQATVGKLVGTRWHRDALRRGDVLFFLGRRGFVGHAAIYLGGDEFIESADGGVRISSLDPNSPLFARGRAEGFCFAKRIIDDPQPRGAVLKPPIISPQEWGSTPKPIPDSRRHTPKYITIHHAGVLWEAKVTAEKFVKNMQSWGQKDKNWPDLPYHFLIAPDGRIFEGRPLEYEPESNTKYELAGNIGVEMMGNFNEQRPSEQQLQSCVMLVAWLAQELNIDPKHIRAHKDAAPGQTDCPGKDFYRYLQDGTFRAWVVDTMNGKQPLVSLAAPLPDGPTRSILEFAGTQPASR